jgi:hypothetical protein
MQDKSPPLPNGKRTYEQLLTMYVVVMKSLRTDFKGPKNFDGRAVPGPA